jgi:hypothetical protein
MERKQLERLALSKLEATAHDDEQWSFLFRAPGAHCLAYCPWIKTEGWDLDGDLDDLDLPWTTKRRREISAGADLTPEELTQWRRAKCKMLAGNTEWAHIAWIVPIRVKRRIEGYALFACGNASTSPDESPDLLGIFYAPNEANTALSAEGAMKAEDE